MKRICTGCRLLLGEISPLSDPRETSGLCRVDELRMHAHSGTITPEETVELEGLERAAAAAAVTVTARVSPAAAARLTALLDQVATEYPHADRAAIAGLALTRELHRLDEDLSETAVTIYRPLPVSFFAPHVAETRRSDDGGVTPATAPAPETCPDPECEPGAHAAAAGEAEQP